MSNYRLENLEYFGRREIAIAANLMQAYADNMYPQWFTDDDVTVEFNPHSGNVFLTNSEFQVLMLEGIDKLVGWHYLGHSGEEGTADDLWYMFEMGDIEEQDDLEQLADIFEMEEEYEHADAVRDYLLTIQE